MNMRDDVLPTHDYFIFVPVTRGEKHIFDEHPSRNSIWHPEEVVHDQDLRLSWTRIALAETLDIYARF